MTKFISCRCPNCGANLKYKDGDEKVTCSHCNSDILIEKDMDQELKKTIVNKMQKEQKVGKVAIIVFIIIFICIVCGGVLLERSFSNDTDKKTFNFQFEHYNGSTYGSWLKELLNEIVSSNKTNKNHQITVVYGGIKTSDEKEILELRKSIIETENYKPKEYVVLFDYDDNGYIDVMTISE